MESGKQAAMQAEGASSPAAGASGLRGLVISAAVALGLLLIAWAGARAVLLTHSVFAFNDGNIEAVLSPSSQYPAVLVARWDNQFFFGKPGGTVPLTLNALSETLLGPVGHRRAGVVMATWLAGLAGLWCCRQFGLGRLASAFGALLIMLCGWSVTFPTVGLPVRTYTLAFALFSIGWIERGRRGGGWLPYAVGGGLLGLGVSETPDVGIMFAVGCAFFFLAGHILLLRERTPRVIGGVLARFALYTGISLLIAWQVLVQQFSLNVASVADAQGPEDKYAWATQWSLPKAETWSLLSPGFHGASSRSPESPYWGGMGRDARWEPPAAAGRNFSLAGYAIGAVPILWLTVLYACALRRRPPPGMAREARVYAWVLGIGILASLMLSWGKHFPLYRLFYALPYMDSIRNPDKWLGVFSAFTGLAVAYGVEVGLNLIRRRGERADRSLRTVILAVTGLFALVSLAVWVGVSGFRHGLLSSLRAQGYGDLAGLAWSNAHAASLWTVAIALVLLVAAWVLFGSRSGRATAAAPWVVSLLMLVMGVELLRAGAPYMLDYDHRYLDQPDPIAEFLQENEPGRLKTLPSSNPKFGGFAQLFNNWRMTHMIARGYDLFDPVSVRAMPANYDAFFKALSDVPLGVWQLGAVRYLLTTADMPPQLQRMAAVPDTFTARAALGISRLPSGRYVPADGAGDANAPVQIVEFMAAAPMYQLVPVWNAFEDSPEGDGQVLERLKDPAVLSSRRALVQGPADNGRSEGGVLNVPRDRQHAVEGTVNVELPQPGLLRRAVAYDRDWKVFVDGAPADLLRVNYLFQGVMVPSGRHEVTFRYMPSLTPLRISVAGRLGLLVLMGAVLWRERRRHRPARSAVTGDELKEGDAPQSGNPVAAPC